MPTQRMAQGGLEAACGPPRSWDEQHCICSRRSLLGGLQPTPVEAVRASHYPDWFRQPGSRCWKGHEKDSSHLTMSMRLHRRFGRASERQMRHQREVARGGKPSRIAREQT
eukprot:scaffold75202_cov27-Tisochrysis_lutea.AAC.3